jgi:hypothetical protein
MLELMKSRPNSFLGGGRGAMKSLYRSVHRVRLSFLILGKNRSISSPSAKHASDQPPLSISFPDVSASNMGSLAQRIIHPNWNLRPPVGHQKPSQDCRRSAVARHSQSRSQIPSSAICRVIWSHPHLTFARSSSRTSSRSRRRTC